MAKWCGVIGFAETVETDIDVWEEQIVEHQYFGDVLNIRWNRRNSGEINDDIAITNSISIVADPYAVNHCAYMKYIEYAGTLWQISDVSIEYPRLNLTLGGVYNVG